MTGRRIRCLAVLLVLPACGGSENDRGSQSVAPVSSFEIELPGAHPYGTDVVAADGVVFIDELSTGVSRLDPSTKAITKLDIDGLTSARLGIGGGSLWVADDVHSTVYRVDPDTLEVTGDLQLDARELDDVVYDDGTLWVPATIDEHLFEIDASTLTLTTTHSLPGYVGDLHVFGDDLWGTGDEGVVRFRPSGAFDVIPLEGGVFAPAVGAITADAASVWAIGGGKLNRIDPDSFAIVEAFDAGGAAIESDGTSVWLAGDGVTRFDIATKRFVETFPLGSVSAVWLDGSQLWAISQTKVFRIGEA